MMYYTGIGSRQTPEFILAAMTYFAHGMSRLGYCLRSGNAGGADTAFYNGHTKIKDSKYEVYLPWPDFGDTKDEKFISLDSMSSTLVNEAIKIVKKVHPTWDKISQGAKKLHTRNVFQVLGQDLKTPSDLLICWTPRGEIVGGTATAIRIAKKWNVPVWNLGIS